jgi:hypothetical protein
MLRHIKNLTKNIRYNIETKFSEQLQDTDRQVRTINSVIRGPTLSITALKYNISNIKESKDDLLRMMVLNETTSRIRAVEKSSVGFSFVSKQQRL